MKNKILISSAGSSMVAAVLGIIGTLTPKTHDVETFLDAGRLFGIAGIFGLLGIALFFVGLAFPREEVRS